jgi:hypothetical protein
LPQWALRFYVRAHDGIYVRRTDVTSRQRSLP